MPCRLLLFVSESRCSTPVCASLPAIPSETLTPLQITRGDTPQERIAAKMRQKLPHSPTDTPDMQPPQLAGGGSAGDTRSQVHVSSSNTGSSFARHTASPSDHAAGGGGVLGASADHELSHAVFGRSSSMSSSSSNSVTVSGPNSDAPHALQPSLVAQNEPGNGLKETAVGSSQVSLLEFRRLVAAGLPNPATRYFVVTGRGLAGAMRVTSVTQVRAPPCA